MNECDETKIDIEFLKTQYIGLFIERPQLGNCPGLFSLQYCNELWGTAWYKIKDFDTPEEAKIWADMHDLTNYAVKLTNSSFFDIINLYDMWIFK